MVTTKQKPIVNIQKIKRKEYKHTTKGSEQESKDTHRNYKNY